MVQNLIQKTNHREDKSLLKFISGRDLAPPLAFLSSLLKMIGRKLLTFKGGEKK